MTAGALLRMTAGTSLLAPTRVILSLSCEESDFLTDRSFPQGDASSRFAQDDSGCFAQDDSRDFAQDDSGCFAQDDSGCFAQDDSGCFAPCDDV